MTRDLWNNIESNVWNMFESKLQVDHNLPLLKVQSSLSLHMGRRRHQRWTRPTSPGSFRDGGVSKYVQLLLCIDVTWVDNRICMCATIMHLSEQAGTYQASVTSAFNATLIGPSDTTIRRSRRHPVIAKLFDYVRIVEFHQLKMPTSKISEYNTSFHPTFFYIFH